MENINAHNEEVLLMMDIHLMLWCCAAILVLKILPKHHWIPEVILLMACIERVYLGIEYFIPIPC